ncbi:MAG: LytTR family DNA-binding domain-containing protein [Agrobacterium vaccinii]
MLKAQMAPCDWPATAITLRRTGALEVCEILRIFQFTHRQLGVGNVGGLRRILIEQWGMLVVAAILGFLGPFGTYLEADFAVRVWRWWMHMMGAYVLVRPSIFFWSAVALATSLPRDALTFWGVALSSVPLALVWAWGASVFFHALNGVAGILPFAFLSAIAVLGVTRWARLADDRLRSGTAGPDVNRETERFVDDEVVNVLPDSAATASILPPEPAAGRLGLRLSATFVGPVLALQGEDHYVRVHGPVGSELIFMRLRDAIAEMDGALGEQIHRSWWVANDAIISVVADGRNRTITLRNGQQAPVARESVARLERSGFLPIGQS